MKKENPKYRWHLTAKEKEEIRRFTLQRVSQATIGRILGIGRDTVSVWQRKMGLPTRPPVPEAKILKLLRKGVGQHRIHKMLGVSAPKVHRVMVKYGIFNGHVKTPKENEERFVAALKRREGYIRTLAKRYGVAFCRARKIAHEVLQCLEFRPGACKPPLSSNLPRKHFDPPLDQHRREEALLHFVNAVLAVGFGGRLPDNLADLSRLIALSIGLCVSIFKRERPELFLVPADQERLTDYFMPRFLQTINTLRKAQQTSEAATWAN